jgi:hypothetical protein
MPHKELVTGRDSPTNPQICHMSEPQLDLAAASKLRLTYGGKLGAEC